MSRSILRLTERCLVLDEVCEGLLTRIWTLKVSVPEAGTRGEGRKYPSVQREEWSKIRKKIESSFPELPETAALQKIQGFDSLKAAADDVIKENVEIFALLMDSLDFKMAALEVLFSVFGSRAQYQLARAPQVLYAAMDLLVGFSQLHVLWASVEERKYMVSLFMCAHHIKNDHRNDPFFDRISKYMDESSTGLKWLTQQFASISLSIGDVLLEMVDPLCISLDPLLLRQMNTFSVLEEGAAMALPAKRPLSARSPRLFMHLELSGCARYALYVLWGALVCPGELFREPVLAIFKTIAGEHPLIQIFRDQSLDVQSAVEEVLGFFPPKAYVPPEGNKDLKHKKIFKEVFKSKETFVTGALLRHRERAAYLKGELANLVHLLKNIPGLLAPKLPMVVALASLCKAEVLWSLRHGDDERLGGSKRSKKASQADQEARTSAARVVEMMGLLESLWCLVREHWPSIIRQYYVEFLLLQGSAHRTGLQELITEAIASAKIEGEAKEILLSVDKHLDAAAAAISTYDSNTSITTECESLKAIRLGWTRVLTYLAKSVAEGGGDWGFKGGGVLDRLSDRLNGIVVASTYIDCMEPILDKCFLLHHSWWYRERVMGACNEVLEAAAAGTALATGDESSSSSYGPGVGHFLAVVRILGDDACRNVHPSCADEERRIREQSVLLASDLVESLVAKVASLASDMYDNIKRLTTQVSPVEALLRMERAHASKKGLDPPPGYESTATGLEASPVVRSLMMLEATAALLLQIINRTPELRVAQRRFYLKRQVAKRLDEALHLHIEGCYDRSIARPSVAVTSIFCYVRALQRVAHYIDVDIVSSVRRRLLEAGWVSSSGQVALVGDAAAGPQSFVQLDHTQALSDQSRPIGRISSWFISFLETLSSSAIFASSSNALPPMGADANNNNSQPPPSSSGGGPPASGSSGNTNHTIFVESRRTFIRYNPTSAAATGPSRSSTTSAATATSTRGVPTSALVVPNTPSTGVTAEAELFTDINEMRALVELVGPMGVEIIDADLLSYINGHMREVKTYLDAHAKALNDFRGSYSKAISPVKPFPAGLPPPGTERLLQDLLKVGNAVAVRQLLYSALEDQQNSKLLRPIINNAMRSTEADPLLVDHARAVAGFDRLACFTGSKHLPSHDFKLASCLDQVTYDWHVWVGLVPALALSLACDWWRDAGSYVVEHDAFTNNQQLIFKALVEILAVIKAKSAAAVDKDKVDPIALAREFVAAASLVFLKVKHTATSPNAVTTQQAQQQQQGAAVGNSTSIHVLLAILEKFVDWCPDVDRGVLEANLPHAMIHHAHMELALDRQQHNATKADDLVPIGLGGGKEQINRPLVFLEDEHHHHHSSITN